MRKQRRRSAQRLCFRHTDSEIPLSSLSTKLHNYVNPKFQSSSHLLRRYSSVCVGPGRKPRRPVFSQRGSMVDGSKIETLRSHPLYFLYDLREFCLLIGSIFLEKYGCLRLPENWINMTYCTCGSQSIRTQVNSYSSQFVLILVNSYSKFWSIRTHLVNSYSSLVSCIGIYHSNGQLTQSEINSRPANIVYSILIPKLGKEPHKLSAFVPII